METNLNIPCQVCAVTSTKGEITPLWCRYQTDQGELIKIQIDEVKIVGAASGTGNRLFECTSYGEEQKQVFLLAMDMPSLKWRIMRRLV